MEAGKPDHPKTFGTNERDYYVRRASMVLVSLSLLSLLLSYFTATTCYVSTFLLSFVAHTLQRKYMFLLCNGILIFLARKDHPNTIIQEDIAVLQPADHPADEPAAICEEAIAAAAPPAAALLADAADGSLVDEEEEEHDDDGMIVAGEDDDDEGPSSGNTEELNNKFEEFIRKMKEELKLQVQQHQITAA